MKGNKRRHHELDVWQDAMSLVEEIYRITAIFPADEKFGLMAQLRRAAVSVPSNIAEGAARGTKKEFKHALYLARGSLSEVETQLQIAERLGYTEVDDAVQSLVSRIFARLGGLINSLS